MSNPKSLVTTAVFKNLHTTGNFINKISTFIHVPCKQLHMTLMILYITSKSNNFLGGWYKWKILKTPTNKWWLKNMKLNSHLIGYCQSLFFMSHEILCLLSNEKRNNVFSWMWFFVKTPSFKRIPLSAVVMFSSF